MDAPTFSPCRVHIDLARLRRNLRRLSPDPRALMPVLKSDAYGHGLLPVARVLAEEGVAHFAVGTVDEGAFLRAAGLPQQIFVLLGALDPHSVARAAAHDLTLLIHNAEGLALAAAQADPARPLSVAIKCDTGMARLGFTPEELPALSEALAAAPGLRLVLALSHLACADMPEKDAFTRRQAVVFADMCRMLEAVFPALRRSLVNSAGLLAYGEFAEHLSRPGQALYGGNVLYGTAWAHLGAALEPVMSVSAPVLHVRDVPPGQSAGYGGLFTAQVPTRLAVLGIGYAEGYPRGLSCRGEVCIAGYRAPVRGRVCMGMILADVTRIPVAIRPGETAWVAGGPYRAAVAMRELAEAWGTIPYEAQCLLGRNSRIYST